MLSILSDTQKAVVDTITMRLYPLQALHYLKEAGHEMSRRTYFRHKKKIEEMKVERMHHIALHFQDQHLERVDKCEIIEKEMWKNYYLEKDPTKRVHILTSILEMQPYLSSYYDATRYVLKQNINTDFHKPSSTSTTYLSINATKWGYEETKRQKEQGNLFNPYAQMQPISQGQGQGQASTTQTIEDEDDDRVWK